MGLLNDTVPDNRYGGASAQSMKPAHDDIAAFPPIDLQAFQRRWMTMRLEAMSKWYMHWRDLSRYINPKRGWFEGFVPNYNAQYDYRLIMDGDPAQYARILSSGMSSGLTSPSRPWFRLGLENIKGEVSAAVKIWLEDVERILLSIFAKSNIYDAFQQTYQELGMFGTGCFGIYEDFDTVIRCRSYTIGEYYLATDYTGRVNSFARQFWMTIDQVVSEYGWENCSQMVQNAYNANNRDQFVLIYTLCEPNLARVPGMETFKGMKFRSITWEAQAVATKALKISGYNEFPICGPRWETTTTADVYGVGPGWFALGDIKALYRMKKDLYLITNKIGDPPVIIDASVDGQTNMLPGGITRSSANTPNAGARAAYQIGGDPVTPIRNLIFETKQQISSRFYADLFLMMVNNEKNDMTAREVVERHEEKMLMLGPVLSRVQSDMLNPAIDRTFAIAMRAGLIPSPPPEIEGQPIKVEYISLLAQAQKMIGTLSIEQEATFVANLAAVFPTIVDNFDQDEAVREHSDLLGVPKRVIRSKEDVQAIRDARAQAQQATAQQMQMQEAAKTANMLSKTQVGDRNALEHITGAEPAQAGAGMPQSGGMAQ